jgi:molecular chaperone DnaK
MRVAVGVDLGTTNSAIARLDAHGKPVVIPNAENASITPSVICFRDGEILVGDTAKEMQALGTWPVAAFFKRQMGDPLFLFHADGTDYTATDLSAVLLRKLKTDAEARLSERITHAVITVPAYFRDGERKATIAAGAAAGLDVLQVINEPTAAAVAYGLSREDAGRRLLVYDLGGGTFDVTLLELTKDGVEVRTSDGDHRLGGKDWDDRIIEFLAGRFKDEFGADPLDDAESLADLLIHAEDAKKKLTSFDSTKIAITHAGCRGRYQLDRSEFEEVTADLMERTAALTRRVMENARLRPKDLDGVLLVGGSTRMPMVRRFIEDAFGRPPMGGINVDEAVALGAAVVAAEATAERPTGGRTNRPGSAGRIQIIDVTTHGLGVIAISDDGAAYINEIVLPKDTPIPCTKSQDFHSRAGRVGADGIELIMTQGESSHPGEVAYLGRYVIRPEQTGDAGGLRAKNIAITYSYDRSGTVDVRATDKASGLELDVRQASLPGDVPGRFLAPPRNDPYTLHRGVHAIPYALRDKYGNADGSEFDLAHDGAFAGLRVAVLQLYSGEGFNFSAPSVALAEKGFVVDRQTTAPNPRALAKLLKDSCQLWIVSGPTPSLTHEHLDLIAEFFHAGHGLYVWGDNDPYYADANLVAERLFRASLAGNYSGDQVVGVRSSRTRGTGMVEGHLICTGVENLYEGITIASVGMGPAMAPVVYASNGDIVVAEYAEDGKRALVDGGFTRLYNKWDTAGTGRYVKNAAAWLANFERFGESLFSGEMG